MLTHSHAASNTTTRSLNNFLPRGPLVIGTIRHLLVCQPSHLEKNDLWSTNAKLMLDRCSTNHTASRQLDACFVVMGKLIFCLNLIKISCFPRPINMCAQLCHDAFPYSSSMRLAPWAIFAVTEGTPHAAWLGLSCTDSSWIYFHCTTYNTFKLSLSSTLLPP